MGSGCRMDSVAPLSDLYGGELRVGAIKAACPASCSVARAGPNDQKDKVPVLGCLSVPGRGYAATGTAKMMMLS